MSRGFGCRGRAEKIGILVAQLGTPDAPTKEALKPYLKQFLSDPRVIEKPRWWWLPLLNFVILQTRPKRSAALYKRIWTDKGSPLLIHTQAVTKELASKFGPDIQVEYGMRYGSNSIEDAIDKLCSDGVSHILVLPMYPHYSATTTAAIYDAVFPSLLNRRVVPSVRVVAPYFRDERYVQALADTMNEHLASLESKPDKLVFSYHGIPAEYVKKGDDYCCQCVETTYALVPKLNMPPEDIIHTFQSRFGRDPWLQPYTDETVERLAKEGVKSIAVAAPGFTADCLETLDELGNEAREEFEELGGKKFSLIPCLNSHPAWITALTEIVKDNLVGWVEDTAKPSSPKQQCPHLNCCGGKYC